MKSKYCTLKNSKLIWKIERIENDKVYLSINNKKMKTSVNDIMIIKDYLPENNGKISITTSSVLASNEIMLRHMTKIDAIDKLDKFIDTAVINHIPKVKIIHGKNGGIIRSAVHEYLDNNPYVSSYNFGEYYEGSYGVTIAYMNTNHHM